MTATSVFLFPILCLNEVLTLCAAVATAAVNALSFDKSDVLNDELFLLLNSLTPKSVPAGTKLVLFGRYVLNIYVGIVPYFLRTTKTKRAKIYLPTQRTNRRISYDIN